ncbi:MAG TPA: hypothetical protein VI911_02250 [Patescibacteria group bacterium]|nr:hypothetical protein [Patescibacteria group bacterium]
MTDYFQKFRRHKERKPYFSGPPYIVYEIDICKKLPKLTPLEILVKKQDKLQNSENKE